MAAVANVFKATANLEWMLFQLTAYFMAIY